MWAFAMGGIERSKRFINGVGKIGENMVGYTFAIDFFQETKYNMKGIYKGSALILHGRSGVESV